MRTWLQTASEAHVRAGFEQLMPAGFVFLSSDTKSGELRWRQPLSNGFAVELTVHPTSVRGDGFAFQTKLYFTCADVVQLERLAGFSACLPGRQEVSQSLSSRGILASMYLEGLSRLLHGLPVELLVWHPTHSMDHSDRWQKNLTEGLRLLIGEVPKVRAFPRKLLELQELAQRGSPSPIALFGNAYVLAAEAALLLSDEEAAAEYVRMGRAVSWAIAGKQDLHAIDIAECKARRLEALGFRRPST